MKNFKKYIAFSFLGLLTISCEQELENFSNDPCDGTDPSIICHPSPIEDCPTGASAGSADFTKFVAIGSSFTAGFQAGALFTDGQNASVPAILASKFACVGGPATFNQPTIGTDNGFNIFVTPNPVGGTTVLGRFRLQGTPPAPSPVISDIKAIPNPQVNPDFIYTGSKTELNNFAVQAVILGQALITETGNWAIATNPPPNPFNPFYARFASNPGTSTMLTDMIGSLTNGGTFFMMWLGMDDVLLYSVYGGDPTRAPLTPLDGATGFTTLYNTAIGGILTNPTLKGVVANFPDIFTLPHFTSVPYNPIVFVAADQSKIDQINAGYAPYNGGLDLALAGGLITQDEADRRKIQFAVGANPSVIEDESLTDLSGLGLPSLREATASDKFPLTTGSILGKEATPGDPTTVWGVTKALSDQYALVPAEITEINDRLAAFNTVVKNAADGSDRVAFADVNKALKDFVAAQAYVLDGVTITPGIAPPTGIYSEDGIHPNTRGYAFLAGVFVDAINSKFGATIPKPNLSKYGATGLPINP